MISKGDGEDDTDEDGDGFIKFNDLQLEYVLYDK